MKKIWVLIIACLTLIGGMAAADTPAGYPEIRIDPKTGSPYDLDGQTVYIMDYWSGDGSRETEPTLKQQAQYAYQDWLMETYNCTIIQRQDGDWLTNASKMMDFASSPDGSLRVYIIEPGSVGSLVTSNSAADWSKSTAIDLDDDHWNQATVDLMTIGSQVYGVSAGASEPYGLVYFNKRLLTEAGIDWNDIYDMQAAGTWTWDAFETMCQKATRDTDYDGVIDVWGVSGMSDDLYNLATFSNGGSFFDFDADGKLQPTMDSSATLEALNWGQDIQASYWMHTPAGASWDWYKSAWKSGQFAFYVYPAYGGFNNNSEMSGMADEWGAVAFPVPSKGDPYITVISENTALIPNVYDSNDISKISMIYDLWTQPIPGYEDDWIGSKYNFTDDRAVDETYAMLRESEHNRASKGIYLGSQNDVLGSSLLWYLPSSPAAELIEAGMPAWQAMCDEFNASRPETEDPVDYPAIRIDPKTGKPYDLGGQTVYIMDYWSGDGSRDTAPTEQKQAQYDYQDWLMETYNCTIIQRQDGDWVTNASKMIDFTSSPDGSLRVYIIEPGKVGSLVGNGMTADWSKSTAIDLDDDHWNQATVDLMTIGSQVYGVSVGKSEPRGLVYFNKRLLTEAGIDWSDIYDMQAAGTWTWDAFETMCKKATRDVDSDGIVDTWGVSGMSDDLYVLAAFSNGGSFFDFDSKGKLQPTMDSSATLNALNWGKDIQDNYWMHTPDGANWDWYKSAWKSGQFAFYIYYAYGGFNDNSEMSGMEDEWGAVAFPVPSQGDPYITVISENTALIPNVYSSDEISKISMIYDLWTQPLPGYYDEDDWIGNKYNYTDERAVDETYAMLRQGEHGRANKVTYLGTQNDVLGSSLLWYLPSSSAAELIEAGMPAWQAMCDTFNGQIPEDEPDTDNDISLAGLNVLNLPDSLTTVQDEAFTGIASQAVVFPTECTFIGGRIFDGAPNLQYVVIPDNVTTIASSAFTGCPSGMKVLVQDGSYAASFCNTYGISCVVITDEAMDTYVSQDW